MLKLGVWRLFLRVEGCSTSQVLFCFSHCLWPSPMHNYTGASLEPKGDGLGRIR